MNLENRKYVVVLMVLAIALIFIIRLFYLQIIDDSWKDRATRMTEKQITIYPARGLIYDRNGVLLVTNKAMYDLMVLPKEVKDIDTTAFCEMVGLTKEEFKSQMKKAVEWPNVSWKPSVFIKQIMPQEYAAISEQLYRYEGFYGQPRTLRNYPHRIGALLLGDVGEVTKNEIEEHPYYRPGDYIGKGGIEKSYETQLRGQRGVKYVYRDNLGREQGVAEGKLDSIAVPGSDLYSTIDAELQGYGEKLMTNKKGCIVAIEPKTGEILALVSSPTYDPNLMVGRNRGKYYSVLQKDSLKPLYNRAVKGQYRPGSIFKMVQSLVALQEGVITPNTRIPCNRSIIGCHGPHSYDNLELAIQHSCNPYFHQVMKRMVQRGEYSDRFKDSRAGLTTWQENIHRFGLGQSLQTDIPGAKNGSVPGPDYYDKIYGGQYTWAYSTIYSLSIGEGELLITPLHMANLAAIIANRGYYYPPHVTRSIDGKPLLEQLQRQESGVDPEHFEIVVNAMQRVIEEDGGTARRARIEGMEVCGKTGTVQNDPLPDHSVFMAFAPKDDPKIAIAVYVEYAGYGGQWAGPIASLMIEKYVNDSIQDPRKEKRILDAVILDY